MREASSLLGLMASVRAGERPRLRQTIVSRASTTQGRCSSSSSRVTLSSRLRAREVSVGTMSVVSATTMPRAGSGARRIPSFATIFCALGGMVATYWERPAAARTRCVAETAAASTSVAIMRQRRSLARSARPSASSRSASQVCSSCRRQPIKPQCSRKSPGARSRSC